MTAPDTSLRKRELETLRTRMQSGPDMTHASVVERRAAWEAAAGYPPAPDEVTFENETLNGVPATIVRGRAGAGTVFYLHGGSYTAGSLLTHRHVIAEIASLTAMTIIVPWYRLAPEHPYPAAIDDAIAAYRSVASIFGPVVVVGDSAGGGLAAAMLLQSRHLGIPMPAGWVCLSPWFDLSLSARSFSDNREKDFVISVEALRQSAVAYLRDVPVSDPLASPVHADWTGLPPLLIHAGGGEILRDDAISGAGAAARGSVPVRLDIWPDMPHGFHLLSSQLSDGRIALKQVADWIAEILMSRDE